MKWAFPLLSAALLSSLVSGQIQIKTAADGPKRDAIKADFQQNWSAYLKYASPMDKLQPVSMKGANDPNYARMSGTIVDALSTLITMGMANTKEWDDLMEIIKKIDFTTTREDGFGEAGEVSVFEMTVRYMAGLLSAYQMNGEKPEERFLVSQAQALADSLSVGWHNGNKIPLNQVNLLKKAPKDTTSDTNLAAAGTLSLEWATLSKYTGEEKYAKLALGSIDAILSTTPHFPYLWSNRINPSDLSKTSTYISLGGGYDSFVEYMIKYPVLVGNLNHPYAKVYAGMVDAISERLVIKTGVKGLKFTADYNIATNSLNYVSSHLACFLGGNIVYAGKLHRNKTWLKLGLELTESCYLTFRATATGVAPYSWGYFDEAGNATGWGFVPSGRREFYNEHGLFVQLGDWLARPEIIESLFYAWRATGNPIWRQYAWEAYQAIKKTASTPSGAYAGIVNTNDPSTDLYDQTESTLYAEVFKYLYLIFSDSSVYSLDEYLFTARGHILKRGGGGGGSGGTKAAKGTSSPVTKRLNAQENTIDSTYVSLLGQSEPDLKISLQAGQKPDSVVLVKAGSDKEAYIKALCSQLSIAPDVARELLAGIPDSRNIASKGDQ